MQVRLEKIFPVDAHANAAWSVLRDIPAVTECLPGAQIIECVDESHYKGQVKFKLGPISAAFNGTIEVKNVNEDQHRIHIIGKGSDSSGSSAASMDLLVTINAIADDKCELLGVADIVVSGKMVSFGNRMIYQASDVILKQFGAQFAQRVLQSKQNTAIAANTSEATAASPTTRSLALIWDIILGFLKTLFSGKTPERQ